MEKPLYGSEVQGHFLHPTMKSLPKDTKGKKKPNTSTVDSSVDRDKREQVPTCGTHSHNKHSKGEFKVTLYIDNFKQ